MIDGIVSAIVRPPRAKYTSLDLGPTRIRHRGVEYKREDFTVTNYRGLKLNGSVWMLMHPHRGDPESCILYLHPNSGSRVDVVRTRIMSIAANAKCTACGFDFAGCGESEGDCVSLGVREKEDVCAVMSYLFSRGFTRFVLWGRSMGAATAAMFYGAYKELLMGSVVALILDSPFTSMQGLANEYTTSRVAVPRVLLSPAVHYLRSSIHSGYGFDINHISPLAAAARINVPTIVLSGSEDKIVPPVLSEELYSALAGPKMRIFFKGGHNTHRPAVVYEAVRVVLVGALRGLPTSDVLRMSAAVLKNEIITPATESHSNGSTNNKHQKSQVPTKVVNATGTESDSTSLEEASRRAASTERALGSLLKEKPVEALTERDISNTLGKNASQESKNGSSKDVEGLSSLTKNGSPMGTKAGSDTRAAAVVGSSQDQSNGNVGHVPWSSVLPSQSRPSSHSPHHSVKHTFTGNGRSTNDSNGKPAEVVPCVYSVSLDLGPGTTDPPASAASGQDGGWIGAIGSLLWGVEAVSSPRTGGTSMVKSGVHMGSPAGSLGYLLHHLDSTVCPPDAAAWESVMLSRATGEIVDAVVDQFVTLMAGLVEAALVESEKKPEGCSHDHSIDSGVVPCSLVPADIPFDERSLMMSMVVAQITSTLGLVSVEGEETVVLGQLLMTPSDGLLDIIKTCRRSRVMSTSSVASRTGTVSRSSVCSLEAISNKTNEGGDVIEESVKVTSTNVVVSDVETTDPPGVQLHGKPTN
mmetsp:Transcript_6084/g.9185  ORF Transcript_6084/g.9185 Transcript_6084/m.9185 type:complete len:753 (-) Transcript_6084:323-2581(-)|eukprot:CAMPEP_0185041220 /NCGR_PEP_ID=MMETSP1103-20130426/40195_1 /TAXON_ID=36769 /ORGANISM="Paraphysomonas bandaiensis, Strain Caron Lab Isolate" /LENGTH=752 /DNA_ID=CAMNT_0027580849 /DNA_START=86 /DNA_END=2344 /DNA_ORIENTATION=+